jgi:hypothetical protein
MDFIMKSHHSTQAASTGACKSKPSTAYSVVAFMHSTPREPGGSGDPGANPERLSAGAFQSKSRGHLMALLSLSLFTLSHSACVTGPANISQAAPGKAEVVIASRDIEEMKSKLLSEMAAFGYRVDKDMPYLLEISRATNDPISVHAVGDASSTHQRVIAYTFTRQGVSTRIIADVFMRAQSSGERVDTMSLNDNGAVYGFFQNQLDRLKKTLE